MLSPDILTPVHTVQWETEYPLELRTTWESMDSLTPPPSHEVMCEQSLCAIACGVLLLCAVLELRFYCSVLEKRFGKWLGPMKNTVYHILSIWLVTLYAVWFLCFTCVWVGWLPLLPHAAGACCIVVRWASTVMFELSRLVVFISITLNQFIFKTS